MRWPPAFRARRRRARARARSRWWPMRRRPRSIAWRRAMRAAAARRHAGQLRRLVGDRGPGTAHCTRPSSCAAVPSSSSAPRIKRPAMPAPTSRVKRCVPPRPGDQAEADFGQAESGLMRGDAQVAAQGQFEPAAERRAADLRQRDLRQAREPREHRLQPLDVERQPRPRRGPRRPSHRSAPGRRRPRTPSGCCAGAAPSSRRARRVGRAARRRPRPIPRSAHSPARGTA